MNWQPSQDGHQLLSCHGYAIRAEGRPFPEAQQDERWFTAFDPTGREVASGYMPGGLAKCKNLCERHFDRARAGEQQRETAPPAAPISNNAAQPCSNNIAAPASTNVPTSPAQTALF